jgi:hypothetical protein
VAVAVLAWPWASTGEADCMEQSTSLQQLLLGAGQENEAAYQTGRPQSRLLGLCQGQACWRRQARWGPVAGCCAVSLPVRGFASTHNLDTHVLCMCVPARPSGAVCSGVRPFCCPNCSGFALPVLQLLDMQALWRRSTGRHLRSMALAGMHVPSCCQRLSARCGCGVLLLVQRQQQLGPEMLRHRGRGGHAVAEFGADSPAVCIMLFSVCVLQPLTHVCVWVTMCGLSLCPVLAVVGRFL